MEPISSHGISTKSGTESFPPLIHRKHLWVTLDIVIPVYNEQEVLDLLFKRLESVFSTSNLRENFVTSVCYVMTDDGSVDRSAEIITSYIEKGVPAILYRLSRNFGHQNAISAGLEHANADIVAILDADLQDPPELILQMIARWREGYDVVYGERTKRKENFVKVSCFWVFYRLLAFLSEIKTPLDSGDFCLLDRRVVQAMGNLPEKQRFPRGLRSWVGFKQTGLRYERSARTAGKSKYSFSKLYRLATDGIASSSIRPLKATQLFSFCFFVMTALFVIISIRMFVSYSKTNEIAIWFLLGYILVALSACVQTLCLYILSAYIGRTYLEVKGRPSYLIMEIVRNENLSVGDQDNGKSGRSSEN